VDACISKIYNLLALADFDKTNLDELVIDLMSETKCGYYFVNHKDRSLVWLHDFDISGYTNEIKGATSPAHISMHTLFFLIKKSFIGSHFNLDRAWGSGTVLVCWIVLFGGGCYSWLFYRIHYELFPNIQWLTQSIIDELQDILTHATMGKSLLFLSFHLTQTGDIRFHDIRDINCIIWYSWTPGLGRCGW